MNNPQNEISGLDFTYQAKSGIVDAVNNPYFLDNDADQIFDLLSNRMIIVSFGDFLKRMIYHKAGMTKPYQDTPTAEYQEIICEEFSDRQTPCSFTPSSTRLRNAARNWLTQQTVNRNVVLLLGFGLGLTVEEVNDLLTDALQEYGLNAKDPFEALCWYCYHFRLNYLQFNELWQQYQQLCSPEADGTAGLDSTVSFRNKLSVVTNRRELMIYLSTLPDSSGARRQSVSARNHFDRLYDETKKLTAGILTETSIESASGKADRLQEKLSRADNLYDFEKLQKIRDEKANYTTYSPDDITPGDIENIILAAVPKDQNGNLVSMKNSSLEKQFYGRRLTRQRLTDILSGNAPITRYDLLTLHFFVLSQTSRAEAKERYRIFIRSANRIMKDCHLGRIYVVNPYECFLLMCMLTDDPFGTYADVWERSYSSP